MNIKIDELVQKSINTDENKRNNYLQVCLKNYKNAEIKNQNDKTIIKFVLNLQKRKNFYLTEAS